jgi:hypothetical protein
MSANTLSCTDIFDGFVCNCKPGYTGSLCATLINECASNPCLNGGTCVNGIDQFVCNCPHGANGTYCQILQPKYTCNITTGGVSTADTTSSVYFTFNGASNSSTPALLMGTGFALNSVVTSTVYDWTPIGEIVSVTVLLTPPNNGWYFTTITCQQQTNPIVSFLYDGWLNKVRPSITLTPF